ncbi:class I SAM-dependent methyltransferase [Thermogemmatispora sp.]|uniref:class I SAM-dependent methyltransferase n=1 Tax=Thermogemmatispora sp. TaxID=1968838 RepID=UPI001E0D36DD|nr:methyltransferase domain-containing protein [Thermogemmatispora sp.]MBX5448487.1 class I SAM-dependent methyltransferase [Thermogemmatispora sp.]
MPWWFFKHGGGSEPAPGDESMPAAGELISGPLRERGPAAESTLPYPLPLPKDMREIDRLDLQHYALRAVLRANYLAPVSKPRRILDAGCGTGLWAYELCQEFPQALVVGLDIEQIKQATSPPANFRFVRANLLDGLPFANDSFDFVHQRLMALSLPITCWPVLVRDLARVTAPGGWIELVEGGPDVAPAGPATQEVFTLIGQYLASRGLDGHGTIAHSLGSYLEDAGLSAIQQHVVAVPMGEWGGPLGRLVALDLRETFVALSERVSQRFQIPREAFEALLQTMQRECNELHTSYHFSVAYGQKR